MLEDEIDDTPVIQTSDFHEEAVWEFGNEVENPPDQSNKHILEKLHAFLEQSKEFPVVVGGIGDSGTEGIRSVLKDLGVEMLNSYDYVNGHGDSDIFSARHLVYSAKDEKWAEMSTRKLYENGVFRGRKFSYEKELFTEKEWEYGRQFVGATLWASKNASEFLRGKQEEPLGIWGMKHPRTMMILPFLHAAMGDKIRFVHVLRDPKAVAVGKNQQIFNAMCTRFYGQQCPKTIERRIQFWVDTNADVLEFAQTHMTRENYMMVRTEDFVRGDEACFERLASFVKLPNVTLDEMDKAIAHSAPYKLRYFGIPLMAKTKRDVLLAVDKLVSNNESDSFHRFNVQDTLEKFGYSTTSFAVTRSCYELPQPP